MPSWTQRILTCLMLLILVVILVLGLFGGPAPPSLRKQLAGVGLGTHHYLLRTCDDRPSDGLDGHRAYSSRPPVDTDHRGHGRLPIATITVDAFSDRKWRLLNPSRPVSLRGHERHVAGMDRRWDYR